MNLTTIIKMTALGALSAAAVATPASAATYDAYLCQTAQGAPNGPVGGLQGNTVGDAVTGENCASANGTVHGYLNGSGPWFGGSVAQQKFTAPADVKIDRIRATRVVAGLAAGAAAGNGQRIGYFLQDENGTDIERREPFHDGLGNINSQYDSGAGGLNTSQLLAFVSCNYSAAQSCAKPNGAQPRFDLSNIILTLRDDISPAVAGANGPLTQPGVKKGLVPITFTSGDVGGGSYRPIFVVDGLDIPAPPVGGQCADADPAGGSPYQFNVLKPCPTAATTFNPALDTTTLSDGNHTVAVYIEDAAGNRTKVWGPTTITVDNIPECRDGIDNDGDGKVDHPADPGCDSPDDETESPDPTKPECSDGIDNDGDGLTDYPADLGCSSATDNSEAGPIKESATDPGSTPVAATPAATNTVTVTTTKTETVNRPVNGINASKKARLIMYFVRTKSAKNTSTFGHRVVMRGRLVDEKGRGIKGARVDLTHVLGGRKLVKTGVRTRGAGNITFIAPMNVTSRTFQFSYRYRLTDKNPVTTVRLKLKVKPRKKGQAAPKDREGRSS